MFGFDHDVHVEVELTFELVFLFFFFFSPLISNFYLFLGGFCFLMYLN